MQRQRAREPKGNETYGFFPLRNPYSSLRLADGVSTVEERGRQRPALSSPAGITLIVFPLRRPSMIADARTVLAGKGSLRRAKSRRALAGCAPFRPIGHRDGRLRREHDQRDLRHGP